MMNGLVRTKQDALAELCRRHGVSRLELFGSGVGSMFRPGRSDLGFLVVFEQCTLEEHTERYFGLLAGLQDLFGCDIDLVEANAVTNPYFLESIESSRTLIYEG